MDLLILLDPPLQNPWWINVSYLGANRLCNLTQLADTIRWALIRRWNSLLLRCVSDEGLCTHVAILREHEAESYPGRIVYFRPHRSWIRLVELEKVDRLGNEIVVDSHHVAEVHARQKRERYGGIRSDDLRGTGQVPDIRRHGRFEELIEDLGLVLAWTAQLVPGFSAGDTPERRARTALGRCEATATSPAVHASR